MNFRPRAQLYMHPYLWFEKMKIFQILITRDTRQSIIKKKKLKKEKKNVGEESRKEKNKFKVN